MRFRSHLEPLMKVCLYRGAQRTSSVNPTAGLYRTKLGRNGWNSYGWHHQSEDLPAQACALGSN